MHAPVETWLRANAPGPFDFVFLDANRAQYVALWPHLWLLVQPGGLVVVDNAISHREELREFTSLVEVTAGAESVVIPVGKGEMLVWKMLSAS